MKDKRSEQRDVSKTSLRDLNGDKLAVKKVLRYFGKGLDGLIGIDDHLNING